MPYPSYSYGLAQIFYGYSGQGQYTPLSPPTPYFSQQDIRNFDELAKLIADSVPSETESTKTHAPGECSEQPVTITTGTSRSKIHTVLPKEQREQDTAIIVVGTTMVHAVHVLYFTVHVSKSKFVNYF